MMTNPNPRRDEPLSLIPSAAAWKKFVTGVDLAADPDDAVVAFKKFEGSGEDAECQPNPAWQSVDMVFLPFDLVPDGVVCFGFEYLDGKLRVQVSEKDLLEWLCNNRFDSNWFWILIALIDQKRRPQ